MNKIQLHLHTCVYRTTRVKHQVGHPFPNSSVQPPTAWDNVGSACPATVVNILEQLIGVYNAASSLSIRIHYNNFVTMPVPQLFETFRHIYIYSDLGTSPTSVKALGHLLQHTLQVPPSRIHIINASALLCSLRKHSPAHATLIMPGGADLPYLKRLQGAPIDAIRSFVSAGGNYLGICAGAYFASARCIFEKDDDALRVVGARPLQLFPYAAVGAVREGFCYGTERGATMERVLCEWEGNRFQVRVYCNGGAGWNVEESHDGVLGRYAEGLLTRHGVENGRPAAVVRCAFGRGVVTLSGVHPELGVEGEGKMGFLRMIAEAALHA